MVMNFSKYSSENKTKLHRTGHRTSSRILAQRHYYSEVEWDKTAGQRCTAAHWDISLAALGAYSHMTTTTYKPICTFTQCHGQTDTMHAESKHLSCKTENYFNKVYKFICTLVLLLLNFSYSLSSSV